MKADMNRLTLYNIRLLLYLLTVGIMSSCSMEEHEQFVQKDKEITIDVPLTKGSANTGDPADSVATARLIILRDGKVRKNIYKSEVVIAGASTIIFENIQLVPGKADFYMITNEATAGWNFGTSTYQEGATLSADVLKKAFIQFSAYPQVADGLPPIPMVGIHENIQVHSDGKTYEYWQTSSQAEINVGEVERLYAKVSIKLSCIFANMPNQGDPVNLQSISIKSMPRKSFFAPLIYTENNFFDGANKPILASNYTRTNERFDGEFEFYIPEYLITDTSKYTYILAKVNLVNSPAVSKDYRIVVGNGIVGTNKNEYLLGLNKTVTDLTVYRNTHYKFTANIVGFDQSSDTDVDITAEIIPWNEGALLDPEVPREYYFDITPTSDFVIATGTGDFEGTVTIVTDHPDGWSVESKTHASIVTTKIGNNKLKFTVPGVLTGDHTINIKAGTVTKQIKIKKN